MFQRVGGESAEGDGRGDFDQAGGVDARHRGRERNLAFRQRGALRTGVGGRLRSDFQHFFDGPNARDGLLGEVERQRDRAHQTAVDIDRAAAHALHDAGFIQRPSGQSRQDDRLLGPDVFQNAQDLDLKFLDLVSGEDGLADAVLAGSNVTQRENRGLRKKTRCYNEDDE